MLTHIEVALAGVANDGLAVGIVGFVERHRSLDHRCVLTCKMMNVIYRVKLETEHHLKRR